jgi:hypothetical protein
MIFFSSDPDDFFYNLNKIPKDLFEIVSSYIPSIAKMTLNREFYTKYHHLFKDYINKRNLEKYIRKTILSDSDFVFGQLLIENYKKWLNMKKYLYQECIYANYLIFIDSYCIEHKSIKCQELILTLFNELGLSKNQHKKNLIRNIRWKP